MSKSYEYKPPLGFDIRVKKGRGKSREEPQATHNCEWVGCDMPGPHRAPRTPGKLNDYRWFCQTHAREYNRAWNFFEDMSDEEVAEYQAATIVGDRPTWAMSANAWERRGRRKSPPPGFVPGKSRATDRSGRESSGDAYGFLGDDADGAKRPERRHVPKLQKKALETLHLDEQASMEEVRGRYKELVKRFHPDANGGDRGAEDRLREVINAYRTLRAANFR
jgi:hypothetical protein